MPMLKDTTGVSQPEGVMRPVESLLVGQEDKGLLLLENSWAQWEQLVNAMHDSGTVPSHEVIPTKYTKSRDKRSP